MLQRDLSGSVLNRPLFLNSGGPQLSHHAIAILAWPVVRVARRRYGSSPLRILIYCFFEWAAMAVLSGFLMLGVGLFTGSLVNQALILLSGYARGGSGNLDTNDKWIFRLNSA